MTTPSQSTFPAMIDYQVEIGNRIREALVGRGPIPLTDEQKAILKILWYRQGTSQAIQMSELRARLNAQGTKVSARAIKNFIRSLVCDFGIKVAARRQPPYGYYLPTKHEEIQETALIYEHEIEELSNRVVALMGVGHAMDVLTKIRDRMLKEAAIGN